MPRWPNLSAKLGENSALQERLLWQELRSLTDGELAKISLRKVLRGAQSISKRVRIAKRGSGQQVAS